MLNCEQCLPVSKVQAFDRINNKIISVIVEGTKLIPS